MNKARKSEGTLKKEKSELDLKSSRTRLPQSPRLTHTYSNHSQGLLSAQFTSRVRFHPTITGVRRRDVKGSQFLTYCYSRRIHNSPLYG